MDTIEQKIQKYQDILTEFLKASATRANTPGEPEEQILIDKVNNHFMLVVVGWSNRNFIHDVLLHFDIKPDGKVWIQVNWTEIQVGQELVARGIPATDIVLGFQPEYARPHTGYAAA